MAVRDLFNRMWEHTVIKLNERVDKTSDETISGKKTFSNGVFIGDAELTFNEDTKSIEILFSEDE